MVNEWVGDGDVVGAAKEWRRGERGSVVVVAKGWIRIVKFGDVVEAS